MGKGGMPEGLKTAMFWALGLGIIALIVLIMSILFGNLDSNLGLNQDTTTFANETINMTGGGTPATVDDTDKLHRSLSGVIVVNDSGDLVIASANYTVTGGTLYNVTSELYDLVNVSATVSYDSEVMKNTKDIISNYTISGTNTTAQFPVVGTIIGVAILLTILIGILIFAIQKMMGIAGGGSGGMATGGSNAKFGADSSSF